MTDKKDLVSKESFEAFEKVRASGDTNMCDLKTVGQLSGLQIEIIKDIRDNYTYLCNKYTEVYCCEDFKVAKNDYFNITIKNNIVRMAKSVIYYCPFCGKKLKGDL